MLLGTTEGRQTHAATVRLTGKEIYDATLKMGADLTLTQDTSQSCSCTDTSTQLTFTAVSAVQ